jgi:hypothetical protein
VLSTALPMRNNFSSTCWQSLIIWATAQIKVLGTNGMAIYLSHCCNLIDISVNWFCKDCTEDHCLPALGMLTPNNCIGYMFFIKVN